jgi:hypothetical protein
MKPTNAKPLPLEARAVQCITQFAAPKTTQDSVDQLCAEFATAYYYVSNQRSATKLSKRKVVDVI